MSGSEGRPRIVLGSARDWLAASIAGVLDHEVAEFERANSSDELEQTVRNRRPNAVMLDQELSGPETPELCEHLTGNVLGHEIPLVVYSSELPDEDLQARIVEAGAWMVLQEPIRSRFLVATLRRFLEIGSAARNLAHGEPGAEPGEELPDLRGVLRHMPLLEALAHRQETSLSVVAVGPAKPGTEELLDRQRSRTIELCREAVRRSDVYGWLGDEADVIILAYGASREDASELAGRLARRAAERSEVELPDQALSAGIVEVQTRESTLTEETRAANSQRQLVEAAREALRRARASGGGIAFAS